MANIKANLLNVLAIGQEIWTAQRQTGVGAAVSDSRLNEGIAGTEPDSPSADQSDNTVDSSDLETGETVMRLE